VARSTRAVAYIHPDDDFLTLDPDRQLRGMLGMVPDQDFAPPETYEHLKHGQVLDLCGMRFEVRHTPGHTPGHCCFLLEEEGVLFSGDQLFAGSIGRTDLPGGDFDQLVVSMRERVLDLPDDVRVLPGHGPETTIGWERRTNPFRHEWA
jgi:glyoxylase-like metal-dependent hydrolase (beta-lactamase superfamily II)